MKTDRRPILIAAKAKLFVGQDTSCSVRRGEPTQCLTSLSADAARTA